MEDIFNMLSSTAKIDKSKRKKNKKRHRHHHHVAAADPVEEDDGNSLDPTAEENEQEETHEKSRDRTGKRDTSEEKQKQIHREQIAAFRRSMAIRLANKHDPDIPDPVSSFQELNPPSWWGSANAADNNFQQIWRAMLGNIEAGRWKEPTPIQMQAIPTLLDRRDFIGAAPTGSGKSGAFLLPGLLLSSAPNDFFYGATTEQDDNDDRQLEGQKKKSKKKKKKQEKKKIKEANSREGEIRCLVVAPTLELASQLHREVERLGLGKPGGVSSMLLSKSNATNLLSGSAGGKHGLDILVTTPLRLVDSIEKGLKLKGLRSVFLDECDRLLDAADGSSSKKTSAIPSDEDSDDEGEDESSGDESDHQKKKKSKNNNKLVTAETQPTSGSSQTKSFLSQMDVILSEIPSTAVRALFSATVTPMVRSLADSVLRNPVDVTIAAAGSHGGANTDIDQQLMFVGREEGKLLAMRQLAQRGQLKAPVIVFAQSQDRAQALFAELLYDGLHVDVIHAGRSKSARDNAVAKFRRGDTWVLICTDLVARGVDFRAVNMVINYDLPASGITYVHRIGRCGRAGRKGTAITLFTEADFDNLRTIANVMKQSGCKVEDWMLSLKKNNRSEKNRKNPRRFRIDTTPKFNSIKKRRRLQREDNRNTSGDAVEKKAASKKKGSSSSSLSFMTTTMLLACTIQIACGFSVFPQNAIDVRMRQLHHITPERSFIKSNLFVSASEKDTETDSVFTGDSVESAPATGNVNANPEYSFFDEATIFVRAGSGGQGSSTFKKGVGGQDGRPDGGNGGRGGDVIFEVDPSLNTLAGLNAQTWRPNAFGGSGAAINRQEYTSASYKSFRAENGADGERQLKSGRYGQHTTVRLPPGTVVQEQITRKDGSVYDKELGSLTLEEPTMVIARGGEGGEGSGVQKNRGVRRKRISQQGGEKKTIKLTLKIVADVALVGAPNAGKSTFLAAVTRAKPKIANYPFTTVIPNLGVWIPPEAVHRDDFSSGGGRRQTDGAGSEGLALCDVPGLIEGAAQGIGLGHAFLRHIERCHVILHLVDPTAEDPIGNFHMINQEITKYGTGQLAEMPQVVVVNKCDIWDTNNVDETPPTLSREDLEQELRASMPHTRLMWMSAKEKDGVDDLMIRLESFVKKVKKANESPKP